MSENGNAPADQDKPEQAPAVNYWWPARYLLMGLAVEAVLWFIPDTFGGKTLMMIGIAVATIAVVLGWVIFNGAVARSVRFGLIAVLAVAAAAAAAALRFDGFEGDMVPIFAWRWSPTPEEQLASFREEMGQKRLSDRTPDLTQTTARDVPAYLGADRLGWIRDVELRRDWQKHPPKELWRRPVGRGWSSFAVVGDFCLTQEQDGPHELVTCYELKTGLKCWEYKVETRFSEAMGGDGPRATPNVHEGKVYAQGATGRLSCLEGEDGGEIWSVNILGDADVKNIHWGMSGSPLIVDDKVIVSPGGPDGNSLVAYDKESGKRLWHAGSEPASYSSPQLTTLHDQRHVLILNGTVLAGHDPKTGERYWDFPWRAGPELISCSQPIPVFEFGYDAGQNQVLVSSGYGAGAALVQISEQEGNFAAEEVWQNTWLKSKFSHMVVHDGCIFGLDDRILTCLDLKDGSRRWKGGRYGFGQILLVGDDLLLIQTEPGPVVLCEANPDKFVELSRLDALTSKTWNVPTLAGKYLLVRNDREAICYELAVED